MKAYIIAGGNGAGKTTFAMEFLPRYVFCWEFLNVDNLFHYYRPLLDSWTLFDNSTAAPTIIASEYDKELVIYQKDLYETILKLAGVLS